MSDKQNKRKIAAILERKLARRTVLQGLGAASALGVGGTLLGSHVNPARAAGGGGHIKLGWINFVDTLDPHFTGFLGAIKVHNNIYNGILKITYKDRKIAFEPDLCEAWEVPDETTNIFRLRDGVHFHNGDPLDAEAVKWSLERVSDPALKSPHAWKFKTVDRVEVIDRLTVKMTMKQPFAFLPVALLGSTGRAGTIVNRRAVEKWGKDYGRHPVGTGPFMLESWKENDSIVLVRNPNYFEDGLPLLDKVTIFLMKDRAAAVAALLSGQVDGLDGAPEQFIPQLLKNPDIQVFGEPEGNYSHVTLNCGRAPFEDINMRRALAAAIDREALVKQAYFGQALPAYTPISPPMTDFFDPNIANSGRGQRFDLAKAKAFRAKAKDQGEVNPVYMATERGGTRVAQLVMKMLEQVGIKPTLEMMEQPVYNTRRRDFDFDMFDANWIADLDPDETINPEWHSKGKWNRSKWVNTEFDALVEEASVILDPAKRRDLYWRAEDILMDEAPFAVLAHRKVFKIFHNRVKNFTYIPAELLNLHEVSIG
jgi:peptide/nickel transport system substrate-binding protein